VLTTRIIPVIFLMDGRIVRSERCSEFKVLGNPFDELARYDEWQADEVCYIDITRNGPGIGDELLRAIADRAFMPLTVGGNVRTLDDAARLIRNGADKVLIGRGAKIPGLIENIADKFGSQAVVVSIDNGSVDDARDAERRGAGEIFLHAKGRDGCGDGYDLAAISRVSGRVKLPVIAAGGVGAVSDFADGLRAGAHAVAGGNIFHFTEGSYKRAKQYLKRQGFNVRWDYDIAA
jgi:cyclase